MTTYGPAAEHDPAGVPLESGEILVYGDAGTFRVGTLIPVEPMPYRLISGARRMIHLSNGIYDGARGAYDILSDDFQNARRASESLLALVDIMTGLHCRDVREV